METGRDNAIRVKRCRELKATLRMERSRLLVGIDIAPAAPVIHPRHAHTRVVVPTLTIPNTTRGFTELWAAIQRARRTTGCREVVVGREPTGTYHQAVAEFLERQGADVVLLSGSVAYWNRRTLDGTWDKPDRQDAANCVDLLEQGKVLFYSQPRGSLADLRRMVKVLRRARAELARCKARWRTTLRPALAPTGPRSRTGSASRCRASCRGGSRPPRRGGAAFVGSGADARGTTRSDASPGSWQREIATWRPARNRGRTAARRSRSQQPGHGRVDPARPRGDRMAPLRWGVRDHPGADLGDGRHNDTARCVARPASKGGFSLDTEKTAGSPLTRENR